jgi:hypothetical protein
MCGNNGCGCCCGPAGTPDPGGDGGGTDGPPRCRRYRLTIDSINVTAIDDGTLGGDLEVDFTFTVNGNAQHYQNPDLDVGTTNIGITFFVDVPAASSTINLTVTGIEIDPAVNDNLAGFTAVYGSAQNWGLGFQTGAASDTNITYTLNYTITCAEARDVPIPRRVLVAYGRAKVEQRRAENVSDIDLEAWALARLGRDSWEIVHATEDRYIMRGYGDLPHRLIQRFQAT